MRLAACPSCHTQYDVTEVAAAEVPCRCGTKVAVHDLTAVDREIHRCSACGALVDHDAGACDYCGAAIVRDRKRLSLICPECFARNPEGSRFCTGCGVSFTPEPVRVDGYELPCPVCTGLMPARQVGGVNVNECPTCHGLWAPGNSFETLVRRAIEARKEQEPLTGGFSPDVKRGDPSTRKVTYRKCPECDAFMPRRNFRGTSGVIVDQCGKHGTWLDADELEQIAAFILSGGLATAGPERPRLAPEAAAALAQMERLRMDRQEAPRRPATGADTVEVVVETVAGLLGRLLR